MKKVFIFILFLLILSGLLLGALYHHELYTWESSENSLWIKNGELFDGTSDTHIANPGILVHNGLIQCMGDNCNVPADIKVIDAFGKSIVPGLIDLHGHFFSSRHPSSYDGMIGSIWDQIRFMPASRESLLQSGITSYRSVGDVAPAIFDLKHKLNSFEIAGPRMFISGPIFTVDGGHPTTRKDIPAWVLEQMTVRSDNPNFVTQKVKELAEKGVDGIKVVYQGHVENTNDISMSRMSKETLSAIITAAKENDLWVAAHTGSQSETIEAINAGITTIEHGIRHGNLIRQATLNKVIANNIVYVPTLGREPFGHLNISALSDANVLIGVGTDGPIKESNGISYYNELKRLVKAGLSDTDALIAATRNGAIGLKQLDNIGTIEQGKYADLLIINGKPWENIEEIEKIDTVIISGRIVPN